MWRRTLKKKNKFSVFLPPFCFPRVNLEGIKTWLVLNFSM